MYTTTYNENRILYDIFQFEFLMRITIQEDQWLHIEFIKSHLLSLLCHYFDDDILHYLLICHLFFLRVSALLSIHFLYLLWLYVSYKIIMINVTDLWISSFFFCIIISSQIIFRVDRVIQKCTQKALEPSLIVLNLLLFVELQHINRCVYIEPLVG